MAVYRIVIFLSHQDTNIASNELVQQRVMTNRGWAQPRGNALPSCDDVVERDGWWTYHAGTRAEIFGIGNVIRAVKALRKFVLIVILVQR